MTTLTETWIPKAPPLREEPLGTVRIGKSRVTLDVLLSAYNGGSTAEEIAEDFDTVRIADVHAVISYYLENRAKVDAYLREREEQAEELRKRYEETHPVTDMRKKLLERRAERSDNPK